MNFSEAEINEFVIEAQELLDTAEKSLLAVDQGESFLSHYDAIFRVYHSVKGAAGMMEMTALQSHMHRLETTFSEKKNDSILSKAYIDLFLKGTDAARDILFGKSVQFEYSINQQNESVQPSSKTVEKVGSTKKITEKSVFSGKVLVIDDEIDIVDIVMETLIENGFEAKGSSSPAEVVGLIAEFLPDVVISDIAMPVMNGLQLLVEIKKSYPDLPVIFLSGHVDKSHMMQAIEYGVFNVIEKPFKADRIVECVDQAVKRHQLVKLLNRTLNLIMYQFSDLSDFLISQGKEDVEKVIKNELKQLLEQKRKYSAMYQRLNQ